MSANPSGTFSHDSAGKLLIVYNATFLRDGAPQPPFDRATGDYGLVTCYYGTAPDEKLFTINGANATATIELDYPGGSHPIPVGMYPSFAIYDGSSSFTLTIKDLLISCRLSIAA